jgi:hypothetical protein
VIPYNLQTSKRITAEIVARLLYDSYDGFIGTNLDRRKTGKRGGGLNRGSGEHICYDSQESQISGVPLFTVKPKGKPIEYASIPTIYFEVTPLQVDHEELGRVVLQLQTALGGG